MLCEPEFLLPIDFDVCLRDLCIRHNINYDSARVKLSTKKVYFREGFFLERVNISENV